MVQLATMNKSLDHMTVVFMGDSITEGQYVHHSLRWAEIVSSRIKRRFAAQIDPDRQYHYVRGVSGETTRQGLERFPRDVQQLRPDVMTLQFGLNDCNCWDTDLGLPRVSPPAYRANLAEMIERARRFGAKHIILSTNHATLRLRPLACGRTLEEQRLEYNDIVRALAREAGVTLFDIARPFEALDQAALAEMLLPEPDVLHLSAKGHGKYAEAIYALVERAVADLL